MCACVYVCVCVVAAGAVVVAGVASKQACKAHWTKSPPPTHLSRGNDNQDIEWVALPWAECVACSTVTAVGFEPTQLALVELESTPLDHSGKVS